MTTNPFINTINENPEVGGSNPRPEAGRIDQSLKYQSIDGVFHAFPPVLVADPDAAIASLAEDAGAIPDEDWLAEGARLRLFNGSMGALIALSALYLVAAEI
jgi:hypothetical protein